MAKTASTMEGHASKSTSDAIEHEFLDTIGTGATSGKRAEKAGDREVFKDSAEGVSFRTVSWQRASIIFLKIQFAMSILSVPGALATLGAVGGALSIVGWEVLNTC